MTNVVATVRRAVRIAAVVAAAGCLAVGCASNRAVHHSSGSTARSSASFAAGKSRYTIARSSVGTAWHYKVFGTDGTSRLTDRLVRADQLGNGDTQLSVARSMSGQPVSNVQYLVHPDGSDVLPWQGMFTSGPGYRLTRRSGGIVVPGPDVLAAGTVETSTLTLVETAGNRSTDVVITAKTRGMGQARVSVPAGSFAALVVSQDMVEVAEGTRLNIATTYYLVAGIGTVKLISTITNDQTYVSTTEILESISD